MLHITYPGPGSASLYLCPLLSISPLFFKSKHFIHILSIDNIKDIIAYLISFYTLYVNFKCLSFNVFKTFKMSVFKCSSLPNVCFFFTRYSSPPKEYLISIFKTMLNLHSQSAYNTVDEKIVEIVENN